MYGMFLLSPNSAVNGVSHGVEMSFFRPDLKGFILYELIVEKNASERTGRLIRMFVLELTYLKTRSQRRIEQTRIFSIV